MEDLVLWLGQITLSRKQKEKLEFLWMLESGKIKSMIKRTITFSKKE